jgi:hypothetical protein
MATRLSSALLLVGACIGLSAMQPLASAQSQVLRPQVRLEQHADLAREVWPADFNGDGITDLVAGTGFVGASDIVAQLGHGDATFGAPYVIGAGPFSPVGVGAVAGDGAVDVLALGQTFSTPETYYILRGRGDGTFDPPLQTSARLGAPVQVLDMNSDGRMDLVVSIGDGIFIHPGLVRGPQHDRRREREVADRSTAICDSFMKPPSCTASATAPSGRRRASPSEILKSTSTACIARSIA